jgi:hypothetical protein
MKPVVTAAALVLSFVAAVAVILVLPVWLVSLDAGPTTPTAAERLNAINGLRLLLLQCAGGTALAAGAYATWHRLRVNEEELRTSREGQVTERYSRAVEHLGSGNTDVRMGGVFALERVARNSPVDRDAIIAILSAYVRGHSPWPSTHPDDDPPSLAVRASDVQAAVTVLGRIASEDRDEVIRLPRTDLRRARMWGLAFDLAIISHSALQGARLSNTSLVGADLSGSDLRGAQLEGALLSGAQLVDADLGNSMLAGADLRGADLSRADLTGAVADDRTRWPSGFDPQHAGVRFADTLPANR